MMKRLSNNPLRWILIGAGVLAAVAATVVILRDPGTDGKTEIVSGENVTAEAMEARTESAAGTKESSSPGSGTGSSVSSEDLPPKTDAGAALPAVQENVGTFETEIVAVVDIHEKAVEALAEEISAGGISLIVPEVVMEEIAIEDLDDSDVGGSSVARKQQKSGGNTESSKPSGETDTKQGGQTEAEPEGTEPSGEADTKQSKQTEAEPESTEPSGEADTKQSKQTEAEPESTEPSGETDTKQDGQQESESESTSPVESSIAESQETEKSSESTEAVTETTTTTTVPVIQKKELVLGEESILVPMDAPESIQEFDTLSGKEKYSLALAFDSVTQYNEYLMLLQKAADQARIEAGGGAVID